MPHQNYSPMCKDSWALLKHLAKGNLRMQYILVEQHAAGKRTAKRKKFPKTKWRKP